jgi:hypothetical protein
MCLEPIKAPSEFYLNSHVLECIYVEYSPPSRCRLFQNMHLVTRLPKLAEVLNPFGGIDGTGVRRKRQAPSTRIQVAECEAGTTWPSIGHLHTALEGRYGAIPLRTIVP